MSDNYTETVTTESVERFTDPKGNTIYGVPCTGKLSISNKTKETVKDDPDVCKITPISAYMSTNLNSKIHTYEDLATRILNFLGYPAVGVTDIHRDQIFEAITTAVELYTHYAGYEKQWIAIDSKIYEPGRGIRLDQLYTIASMEAIHEKGAHPKTFIRGNDQTQRSNRDIYVNKVRIPTNDYFISDKDFELLEKNCEQRR